MQTQKKHRTSLKCFFHTHKIIAYTSVMRYLFIGNICFSIFIFYNIHNSEACHYLQISTKKTWNSTVVVPRFRGLRIAQTILEQQREAHAENVCIFTHHQRRNILRLYKACYKTSPNGHLTLLSLILFYESCEVSKTPERSAV